MSAGSVRLWRWRRNPLRLRAHAAEGWIILALIAAWLVAAPLGGAAAWDAVLEGRAQQRTERHLTTATLVEDAVPMFRGSTRARATARWTASDGTPRTARVPVESHVERGARVPVWTDEDGEVTSAPLGPAAARFDAAVAAVAVAAGLGLAALTVHRLVRRTYERSHGARWAREWARVAPEWDRRSA
ncbi:hypothetical protein ACH4A8_21815 [Streptomyces vietnamensis]|uniref:Rv1733c family protein n=1 Tax=Streptomyces vietnamensis TaxID=362257 RepID=UPI00378C81B9